MEVVEHDWLPTIALVTSSLIAVSANFLLLLVFCRRRGLRTVSNRFVINLLFINLLSSLLLVPFLIIDHEAGNSQNFIKNFNVSSTEIIENINNKTNNQQQHAQELIFEKQTNQIIDGTLFQSKELIIENADKIDILETNFTLNVENQTISVHFCQFLQFCLNFMCTASILSILLIGLDQYIAVIHPLRYHSYINKAKSLIFITTTWLCSIIFALITSLTNTNANFLRLCRKNRQSYSQIYEIYSIIYFFFIIVLPFVGICLIYVFIYNAAHKNSARIRKRNAFTNRRERALSVIANSDEQVDGNVRSLPKVQSAPDFGHLKNVNELKEIVRVENGSIKRTNSEKSANKNIITSLKCKFSNASVFRYREESRTAKISVLVIFMVLICYVPYGIMFIINTTELFSKDLYRYNYISLLLFVSSNIFSPILFAYRNKRIQRELHKFLLIIFTRDDIEQCKAKPRIVISNLAAELNRSVECVVDLAAEPFLVHEVDSVVVECTVEIEKKSILKRVCSKNWSNYKKCSFINVPDSCLDARGSFSSASTQISTEE